MVSMMMLNAIYILNFLAAVRYKQRRAYKKQNVEEYAEFFFF